jgi:methylenetetrahydrofolate reductase (NADPH)
MKIIDIWRSKRKPTISFEVFPARSEKAAESLPATIDELLALKPDFVSVTFGAGGSTREGSYQLVNKLRNGKGLETIAYFAGYGLGPQEITGVLDSYQELGIENLLVVRGDAPKEGEFKPHARSMPHASDLMAFIRPRYNFCIGVAGYPEKHVEAPDREQDLSYLKLKADRGADFIIANYFYDNRYFFDFTSRCRSAGISVPILPGVMPIYSVKMMETLAAICGATITDELLKGTAALPAGDKEALMKFGIDFAARQCRELLAAGVPGLHFYTMDRSASVAGIVNTLRVEGLL